MDVFELRNRLVEDYASYTRSFIKIADERIRENRGVKTRLGLESTDLASLSCSIGVAILPFAA